MDQASDSSSIPSLVPPIDDGVRIRRANAPCRYYADRSKGIHDERISRQSRVACVSRSARAHRQRAWPCPFGARTLALGTYLGVREGGQLLAMAGDRMRVPSYVEPSAISTHPDARGRALAAYLCRLLMLAAAARG